MAGPQGHSPPGSLLPLGSEWREVHRPGGQGQEGPGNGLIVQGGWWFSIFFVFVCLFFSNILYL